MDEHAPDLPAVTRSDRLWSRQLFARLIDQLVAAEASVIVFDVSFETPTDEHADRLLEDAIARSNRVVLFQRLQRTDDGDAVTGPIRRFSAVAAATAVFPLPKVSQVDSYWPFFSAQDTGTDRYEARELPSLPVAALQIRLVQKLGRSRFEQLFGVKHNEVSRGTDTYTYVGEDLLLLISTLRRAAINGQLSNALEKYLASDQRTNDSEIISMLRSLIQVYSHRGPLQLNLYGPSRSVETIDHTAIIGKEDKLNQAALSKLAGSVVFIGHSAKNPVDQRDGIPTVFTRNGLDVSGVEIAASAYANLLDGSRPRYMSIGFTWIIFLVLSLVSVSVAARGNLLQSFIGSSIFAFLYCALSLVMFKHAYVLLPVGIPLLLLVPFLLVVTLYFRYFRAASLAGTYRYGIQQLLPARVASDVESGVVENAVSRRLHGTCLITDIKNFTHYAEKLGHEHISRLSEEYYSLMMQHVYRSNGELVVIDGDSMTVFWGGTEVREDSARQALLAVIDMAQEVNNFNQRHPDTPFVTRFGLDRGWLKTRYYGGGGNYRYSLVGDVANTSSRLEGLNKRLGTTILASKAAVSNCENIQMRPVGSFLLKGKSTVMDVFEIIAAQIPEDLLNLKVQRQFAVAMDLLAKEKLDVAKKELREILRAHGSDGPTLFYLELLSPRRASDVQIGQNGVVRVDGK